MGAINFSLQTITSGSMFRPGEYVWFGQPNQIPDPDNPATLKNPYIDAELTTTASAIQGIDSDSKCEQSTDGRLYGSGTYSIRVMSKADNSGVQRYYLPEVDLTPTESDLVRLTGNVINYTGATGTVTIPAGLAIGTVYEVRKINATQGAVSIAMSGSETVTPAALTAIDLNADGDFWRIRKTTSTRWDLIDGHQTGSTANGEWEFFIDGSVVITHRSSTAAVSVSSASARYGFVSAKKTWTYPVQLSAVPSISMEQRIVSCTGIAQDSATTTEADYYFYSGDSIASSTMYFSFIARGRWY